MYDNNDGKAPSSSPFLTLAAIFTAIAVIVYILISSGKIHFSKKEISPEVDTVAANEAPDAAKEPIDTLSLQQHQALDLVNRYFRKSAKKKSHAGEVLRISELVPWIEGLEEDREHKRLSRELTEALEKLNSAQRRYDPNSPTVKGFQRTYDGILRQLTAYDDGFQGKRKGFMCPIYYSERYLDYPKYAEVYFNDDLASIARFVNVSSEPLEKFFGADGKEGLMTKYFRDTLVPPVFTDIKSIWPSTNQDYLAKGSMLVGYDGEQSRIIIPKRQGKETYYSRWFDEITLVPPIDFGHYLVRSGKYVGVYDSFGYELMPVEYDRCVYQSSVLSCFKGEKEYYYHNDRGRDSISKVIDEHMEVYMDMSEGKRR